MESFKVKNNSTLYMRIDADIAKLRVLDIYDNNDFRPIASENKYLGEPQPGSNINARDMFDVKSDLWNSGWRVGKNNANIFRISFI